MNKTNVRMQRDIFSGNIQVRLMDDRDGQLWVAQPVELKELREGYYAPPFLTIDQTTAQMIVDELWQCGLRPSEGTGSAGALAATEKHLHDMKKIAFKALKIDA